MNQQVAGAIIDCPHCGVRNRIPVLGKTQQVRCGRCGADLPVNPVMHCNESDFAATVMRSPIPVLVDFWAAWCGPCKMLAPELEKLATSFAGKVRVVKVDIDKNPALADRYAIRSVPTMLVVRDGKVVDTFNGAMPAAALAQRLQPWLS